MVIYYALKAKMEQNADVDDSNATSKSILAIAAAQKIEVYNQTYPMLFHHVVHGFDGRTVGSLACVGDLETCNCLSTTRFGRILFVIHARIAAITCDTSCANKILPNSGGGSCQWRLDSVYTSNLVGVWVLFVCVATRMLAHNRFISIQHRFKPE